MISAPSQFIKFLRNPIAIAVAIAACKILLFIYVGSSYGYFRDELYFLACADHLAFGYPDHAPLSVFLADFSRSLFGDSLYAIRFFPAMAGALRILIAAFIVREFGGKYFATLIACLSVLVAPTYLAMDNLLSMNSYESVFWMGCVLSFIWAVKRGNPNYWLLFGAFAGFGLMNKHSMVFFGLAFVIAMLLTKDRKVFRQWQFWMAGAIALIIFLPNLVWQYQNDWATLELLQNVRESGKNVALSPIAFILQQILILNPATFPVWFAGISYLLFDSEGKRFRTLGITFIFFFISMLLLGAKNYYLAPIYPLLFAGGAVFLERLSQGIRLTRVIGFVYAGFLLASGIILAPLAVPVLPVEQYKDYEEALGVAPPKTEVAHTGLLPQHFGDMFGWEDIVKKTADVYGSMPQEERRKAAILAGSYGDAGAIDHFGKEYGLPNAISPHQGYYLWGYRDYDGSVAILLGFDREDAEKFCGAVETRDAVGGKYNMDEENFNILICRDLRYPLPQFWKRMKHWN